MGEILIQGGDIHVGLVGHLVGGQGLQPLLLHQFAGGRDDAFHGANGPRLGGLFFQGGEVGERLCHKTKF